MNVCIPKSCPKQHEAVLAERARKHNPNNVVQVDESCPGQHEFETVNINGAQKISVLKSKFFGPEPRVLTVSFMQSVDTATRKKILLYANKWDCGITFEYTQGTGNIRISRGSGGYWSYLGTDNLSIPRSRQTMNLSGFTSRTSDKEYDRVVPHEFGHAIGCPHEHARKEVQDLLDREKTYAYFRRTSGWGKRTVDQQIFINLPESALWGTEPDPNSIMCYQFPGSCTKSGQPIPGGDFINDRDNEFMGKIYPKPGEPEEPTDPVEPTDPIDEDPLPDSPDWDMPYDTDNDWT